MSKVTVLSVNGHEGPTSGTDGSGRDGHATTGRVAPRRLLWRTMWRTDCLRMNDSKRMRVGDIFCYSRFWTESEGTTPGSTTHWRNPLVVVVTVVVGRTNWRVINHSMRFFFHFCMLCDERIIRELYYYTFSSRKSRWSFFFFVVALYRLSDWAGRTFNVN